MVLSLTLPTKKTSVDWEPLGKLLKPSIDWDIVVVFYCTLPTQQSEPMTHSQIERLRASVQRDLVHLQDVFDDLDARLSAAIHLKLSLQKLEIIAIKHGHDALARVALILHDTLKYNYIEEFEKSQFDAFVAAARFATLGSPETADPMQCDLTLIAAGLTWLPEITADHDTNDPDPDVDET